MVRAELIQGSAPLPAEAVRVDSVHGPHGVNFASSAISARCAVCVKGFVFLDDAAGWLLEGLIRLSVIPIAITSHSQTEGVGAARRKRSGAQSRTPIICFLLASNLTTRASVLGLVQLATYCRYTSRAFPFSHLLHSTASPSSCKCHKPHTVADDLRSMSVFDAGSSQSKH